MLEKKTSILLVDDDAGGIETLTDILTEKGFRVTVACDGYTAISRIEEEVFDMILMDIKMPGISGVETFKCMKQIRPFSKIIFMTAYSSEEIVREAREAGASDVLQKPIDFKKLDKLLLSTCFRSEWTSV
jgi:CheY-like chemotaxis protein